MKKISEHLGEIIVALAGVALLIAAITLFKAPIGNFFANIVDNETLLGNKVLQGIDDLDFSNLGANGAGSSGQTQPDEELTTLTSVAWENFESIDGRHVWLDNSGNIYYSNGNNQYVLEGDTWEAVTWNGLSSFIGSDVWYDNGGNIYYSDGDAQYILNGNTWEPKSWDGLSSFVGSRIWTDGTDMYYSHAPYYGNYKIS